MSPRHPLPMLLMFSSVVLFVPRRSLLDRRDESLSRLGVFSCFVLFAVCRHVFCHLSSLFLGLPLGCPDSTTNIARNSIGRSQKYFRQWCSPSKQFRQKRSFMTARAEKILGRQHDGISCVPGRSAHVRIFLSVCSRCLVAFAQ